MIFRVLFLAAMCLAGGVVSPLERTQAVDWLIQGSTRKHSQSASRADTQFSLSDSHAAATGAPSAFSDETASRPFSDAQHSEAEAVEYPSCVSHDRGNPGKPWIQRSGDVTRKDNPSKRYCLQNCDRAGHPHEVAWWAACAINKNYSAAFVGGGTPWVLPHKTRSRAHAEGTWGMDHNGIFQPKRVWLGWSRDREQGGLGSYDTEGAPAIIESLKKEK